MYPFRWLAASVTTRVVISSRCIHSIGLCDGDVFPDGLGGAGHEGVDPLIPEIPSRADKTSDIAVGQDAEQDI